MALHTRLSAFLETHSGGSFDLNQSFCINDTSESRYQHPEYALNPLTSVTGNFGGMTTAKYIMLETTKPIDFTIWTPTGPTIPPVSTPATIRINNAMMLCAEAADTFVIYNPNSGASGNVLVKITAVGA